jgi:hypothetical protein
MENKNVPFSIDQIDSSNFSCSLPSLYSEDEREYFKKLYNMPLLSSHNESYKLDDVVKSGNESNTELEFEKSKENKIFPLNQTDLSNCQAKLDCSSSSFSSSSSSSSLSMLYPTHEAVYTTNTCIFNHSASLHDIPLSLPHNNSYNPDTTIKSENDSEIELENEKLKNEYSSIQKSKLYGNLPYSVKNKCTCSIPLENMKRWSGDRSLFETFLLALNDIYSGINS